jgi:Flp pilus assembly protein TadB
MLRARRYASEDLAREMAGRVVRFLLVIVGLIIVIAGVLIAPLPGPMGLPIVVVGLMVVLRNSFKARRQFVRFQRAHPKVIFPIRRLLRREPEVLQVAWQQALRIERVLLPKRYRLGVRGRRYLKRRHRARR